MRCYERIGLRPNPARSAGNCRIYEVAEVGRLAIDPARDLGFPLDQVCALLGLSEDRADGCDGIDRIATKHLRDVNCKLADVTALRCELRAIVDSCDTAR